MIHKVYALCCTNTNIFYRVLLCSSVCFISVVHISNDECREVEAVASQCADRWQGGSNKQLVMDFLVYIMATNLLV